MDHDYAIDFNRDNDDNGDDDDCICIVVMIKLWAVINYVMIRLNNLF